MLESLDEEYERAKSLVGWAMDDFPCFVLATKKDLLEGSCVGRTEKVVSWAESRRPRERNPIQVYLTSALQGTAQLMAASGVEAEPQAGLEAILGRLVACEKGTAPVQTSPPPPPPVPSAPSPATFLEQQRKLESLAPATPAAEKDAARGTAEKDSFASPPPPPFSSSSSSLSSALRLIVSGACAVGKTSMITAFVAGAGSAPGSSGSRLQLAPSDYCPTVGADLRVASVYVDRGASVSGGAQTPASSSALGGKSVSCTTASSSSEVGALLLHIWDTSGRVDLFPLGRAIFKGAQGLLLVYDVSNAESFAALDLYYRNYVSHAAMHPEDLESFPCVLAGNKCDMPRAVSLEEVLAWCAAKRPRRPITYIECSVAHNTTIADVFLAVAEKLRDACLDEDDDEDDSSESGSDVSNVSASEDEDAEHISSSRHNRSRGSPHTPMSPSSPGGGGPAGGAGLGAVPRTPRAEDTCGVSCLWGV